MTMSKTFSSELEIPLSSPSVNLLRLAACVVVLASACSPILIAQEQDARAKDAQANVHDKSIIRVPAPLGGSGPQLEPTSIESGVHNILRGGLIVGSLYDDNSIDFGGPQYSVSPIVVIQQTRPHTDL